MHAKWHCRAIAAVLLTALGCASAVVSGQDQRTWVHIVIGGHEAMSFVPLDEPYTECGPGVGGAVHEPAAKAKDGTPIRGFEFTGWKEGDGYRVMVFAQIPGGAPGGARAACQTNGLKRMDFGSVHLRAGTEVAFTKMKEVGVTPWVIRVGPKSKGR